MSDLMLMLKLVTAGCKESKECLSELMKYQHLCHVWHASNKVIHMTKKPYLLSWELFLLQKGD